MGSGCFLRVILPPLAACMFLGDATDARCVRESLFITGVAFLSTHRDTLSLLFEEEKEGCSRIQLLHAAFSDAAAERQGEQCPWALCPWALCPWARGRLLCPWAAAGA